MIDVTELAGTVFSGFSALVIEDVADTGDEIVVRARDPRRSGGLLRVRRRDRIACTSTASGWRLTCQSTAAASR
jgi:hypothetical protein